MGCPASQILEGILPCCPLRLHSLVAGTTSIENKCHLYPNLSRQPAGILLSRRRPDICGLAEFQPKLLLTRPEIYSKPAWGSRRTNKETR